MRAPTNPRPYLLVIGAVFLALLGLGPFVYMIVPEAIIVAGDAVTTAANLRAQPELLRWGMVAETGIIVGELAMVVALYLLFRPVSEGLSLVAASARLSMAIIMGVSLMPGIAALGTMATDPTLTLALLQMRAASVLAWQIFFGIHLLALAVLMFRSGFLPRIFGPLLAIAAAGYLVDSFGNLLAPAHADSYAMVVTGAAVVGEIPVFLWLLVKGVDVPSWNRSYSASAQPAL